MKKIEEIIIGLECCEKFLNGAPEEECCHVCNYANNCAELKIDALNLIQQLEAENAQLKQERDAAIHDCAYFPCNTCQERTNGDNCFLCKCKSGSSKRSHHIWRGPCEENGGKTDPCPYREEKEEAWKKNG